MQSVTNTLNTGLRSVTSFVQNFKIPYGQMMAWQCSEESRSPTVNVRLPWLAKTRLRGKLGRLFVCF